MRAKLLLVDDEPDILEPLRLNLERHGFQVTVAVTAAQALAAITASRPDLIILDLILPDIPGTQLAGRLKHDPATSAIPIVMLTARDTETDMIVGLSVGADDYVTKPFSTQVLVARLEAVLRRTAQNTDSACQLIHGPLKLIPSGMQAYVGQTPLDLTQAEFNILAALIKSNKAILSREKLKAELSPDSAVTDRTIDVHIAALRKKLGPARDIIKTIHRLGYRLD